MTGLSLPGEQLWSIATGRSKGCSYGEEHVSCQQFLPRPNHYYVIPRGSW